MKSFKDFSISRKLLTGFLSLTLIMLLVGGAGIAGLARISQMDTYLYKEQTAPMKDLMAAVESLYQFRVDSRAMASRIGRMLFPKSDRAYSTFGGTTGYTVRVIR